jgi:hypothetical protein
MRKLVLWGHGVEEYQEMFALSTSDLHSRILEYGCGPSAVNATLHKQNKHIISCDSLFTLDKAALLTKTTMIFENMVDRVIRDKDTYVLNHSGTLDTLIAKRRQGMEKFFADYEQGKNEKRYLAPKDGTLPFSDFTFDYALSSHFLFADLDDQDVDFHIKAIIELARVAKEVRIFPLIDRYGQPSPFLGPVLLGLQQEHYGVEVREVNYYLQSQGNAMLRVWAQQCQVS